MVFNKRRKLSIRDPEIRKRETRTRLCVKVGFLESVTWEKQTQKWITVIALFIELKKEANTFRKPFCHKGT